MRVAKIERRRGVPARRKWLRVCGLGFYEVISECQGSLMRVGIVFLPIFWSPKAFKAKPTFNMPPCIARAMASMGDLSCGDALGGTLFAIVCASDAALSGFATGT